MRIPSATTMTAMAVEKLFYSLDRRIIIRVPVSSVVKLRLEP